MQQGMSVALHARTSLCLGLFAVSAQGSPPGSFPGAQRGICCKPPLFLLVCSQVPSFCQGAGSRGTVSSDSRLTGGWEGGTGGGVRALAQGLPKGWSQACLPCAFEAALSQEMPRRGARSAPHGPPSM